MIATLLWTLSLGFLAITESKGTVSCPNDFVLIGKKCYFFSPDVQTWQDAYWRCESANSTLAVITKAEQDELLRNFLNKHEIGEHERWIGGIYDWKQLKWKWGVSEKPMKYQGFPRNKREEQNLQWHCITTDPLIKNRWNSGKCILSKRYICQANVLRSKKPCVNGAKNCSGTYHGNSSNISNNLMNAEPAFIRQKSMTIYACKGGMVLLGNKCYTFSDKSLSWNEADWACRENRTRLAVIRTKHQDVKLKKFLNRGFVEKQERWLGGMYDWQKEVWRWALSGNVVQYTNFSRNLTSTPLKLYWHCITLDPNYRNEWGFSKCTDHKYFICQTKASTVMKYNERRKRPTKKKSEAEIIVKLDKGVNNTKDVEYKFRSGIETFVKIPKRVWNKYPQRKPLKPVYYPKVSAISSRSRD